MNAKMIICALLTVVALVPAASFADGKDGDKGRRTQKLFAELGVTAEQEAKLREIHVASVHAKREYRKHLGVVRKQIREELQKDAPSKKALSKYAADMGDLHKLMNQAFIDDMLKIKEVLTPEQFAKLSERGIIGDSDGMKMHRPDGEGRRGGGFKPGEGPKHRYGSSKPQKCDGKQRGKEGRFVPAE